jgi:hypothetical protein
MQATGKPPLRPFAMSNNNGWIGVDLDGTLAHYDGWKGVEHIGVPVPAMVKRVQHWLEEGKDVRIFTARVGVEDTVELTHVVGFIQRWCVDYIGCVLPVTNVKDFAMVELYDDRCKQVEPNTGRLVEEMGPPCPFCGQEAIATISQDKKIIGVGCFACKKVLWQPQPVSLFDDQKHYHGQAVRVGHSEPKASCPSCAGTVNNAKA